MNRLNARLNNNQHERATIYTYNRVLNSYIAPFEISKAVRTKMGAQMLSDAKVESDLGISFTYEYLGFDKERLGDSWEVRGKDKFKLTYTMGVGHRICWYDARDNGNGVVMPPCAMDVLYCIWADNPHNATFECWCDEFGYDTDSRKAEKAYNACIQQTMMFARNYDVDLETYEPLKNY